MYKIKRIFIEGTRGHRKQKGYGGVRDEKRMIGGKRQEIRRREIGGRKQKEK